MKLEDEIELPDRFRIDREIGRGGMAVVYRAHDEHLDRFVAIKVLSPGLSREAGAKRFQREIAFMAKLVHPGFVALFDSGEVDGRLYYVMPFVAGETLRARLVRERLMTLEDAAASRVTVRRSSGWNSPACGWVSSTWPSRFAHRAFVWAAGASGPTCCWRKRRALEPPKRCGETRGAKLDGWLQQAEQSDPFSEHFSTRTVADRIVTGYADLGEWHEAMDWVERAYERRPGRLRRMLTDPPFDHHGLAVDRRYARLLRVAGMEELL